MCAWFPEHKLLVFADFTHMYGYDAAKTAWQSERLSWDGITITKVATNHIFGPGMGRPSKTKRLSSRSMCAPASTPAVPNPGRRDEEAGLAVALVVALTLALQSHRLTPEQRIAFTNKLVAAADERPQHSVRYDGAYRRLAYPGGDVPGDTGTCTDEIIRIYRAAGIDLQKDVHEDMAVHFAEYPQKWRQSKPNFGHRPSPRPESHEVSSRAMVKCCP